MKNGKDRSKLLIGLSLSSAITSYMPLFSASLGKVTLIAFGRITFQPLDDEATFSRDEGTRTEGVNSTGGGVDRQQGIDLGYLNTRYLNYPYLVPVYFDPLSGKISTETSRSRS